MSSRSADFFFLLLPYTAINNGCFSGLQSARGWGGGGWEWVDGWHEKKNQGEGLGLIRDFLCKINDWAQRQPVEVEGVVQQGCGGQLQVDLEHQDCGPRMFSAGSLQVCLSLSSSLRSRWPQKPNYRTLFIFLETIISHTAKSVWSPHLYKQYDRRGTKQSLLLYSRLSFHSASYVLSWWRRGQITQSCLRMPLIHEVLGSFGQRTRCTPGYKGESTRDIGDQRPRLGTDNTPLPPCGHGQMTLGSQHMQRSNVKFKALKISPLLELLVCSRSKGESIVFQSQTALTKANFSCSFFAVLQKKSILSILSLPLSRLHSMKGDWKGCR